MKNTREGILIGIIGASIYKVLELLFVSLLDLIQVPELYLFSDSKLLLGPPYFSFLLLASGIYVVILTMTSGSIWNRNLGRVCSQFNFFSDIDFFASNGTANHEWIKDDKDTLLKITLQNKIADFPSEDGFTTSADCGIIFRKTINNWPFPRGFLIDDKNNMCFEIRGEYGGEKIGLALKNTFGHELKYSLDKFLENGIRKNGWEKAEIDLSEYAYVTRGAHEKAYLENFSIFTNSLLSGTKKQVFYIRKIQFL